MMHAAATPVIIAHRGACGYLPEHSFPAKILAHAQGADFLEQDLVATADGELIVFHDLYLDATTNVRERYPGRARDDGLHYCLDFTLAEIRQLEIRERCDPATGKPLRPNRWRAGLGGLRVPTLAEELALIDSLNRTTGRQARVYPELKAPAWHRDSGRIDVLQRFIEVLADSAWATRPGDVYLQCFEAETLLAARSLLPVVPRIQLLPAAGEAPGLEAVATYAQGIGPALDTLWAAGTGSTGLRERARAAGLEVHPYTFRADDLPPGFDSFDALLDVFLGELRCDGLFVEQPDRMAAWLAAQSAPQ